MRCPSESVVPPRRLPWDAWNASPPCSTRPPGAIAAPAWSRASSRWRPSPAPSSSSSSPCRCSASECSTSSRSSRSPCCGGRDSGSASRSPHAGFQLVLPAAHPHVHAGGLAKLARAGGVRGDGSGRQRAGGAVAAPRHRVGAPGRDRRPRSWPTARCAASSSGSPPRSPRVLQVDRARIELGRGHARRRSAYPLVAGARQVGVIHLDDPAPRGTAARRRLIPALASLLGVAVDRERLAAEALEAEALRRTDAMKTALLRAVSHDLRSPLMAILTAASALARDDLELDPDDRRELLGPSRPRPPGSTDSSPTCSTCRASRRAPHAPRPTSVPSTSSSGMRSTSSETPDRESTSRYPERVAGGAGRLPPDRACARQPDGERDQVLAGGRTSGAST